MKRHCCVVGCECGAEFEITPIDGPAESNTDACRQHVGELLGWATYDTKMVPSWIVTAVPKEPKEIVGQ